MSEPAWAGSIAEAYAAGAKPPLTHDLAERVHRVVAEALDSESRRSTELSLLDGVNLALDHFEGDVRSIVGPRVSSLDEVSGRVEMRHRSEAGQPLRAYGGQ